MDVDARLEALETENERLRDELDALKESVGLSFVAPLEWGLTPSESRVFGRLLKGTICTKDAIMASLYRDAGKDEPEVKIVDVFVCKLRKKIKVFGMEIRTVWGQGYAMDPEVKAAFQERWARGSA